MSLIEQPARFERSPAAPREAPVPKPGDRDRADRFREAPYAVLRRWVLGTAWALRPKRIGALGPLSRLYIADLLGADREIPDPTGLDEGRELAGLVGDIAPAALMEAYRRGLFPHGHCGPLKWMSPAMRSVLRLSDVRMSSRLRARLRRWPSTVTFDRDFDGVMAACAAPRRGRWPLTWITPRIMHAYAKLFDAGYAHSFEVWNREGELVGGAYGVAVGRVFVIESLFHRESNASKFGFWVLAWHLAKWGFDFVDVKWSTPAFARMGFEELSRADYLKELSAAAAAEVHPGRWAVEAEAKTVAASWPHPDGRVSGEGSLDP